MTQVDAANLLQLSLEWTQCKLSEEDGKSSGDEDILLQAINGLLLLNSLFREQIKEMNSLAEEDVRECT